MTEKKTAAEIVLDVMNKVQSLAKKEKNTAQGFNFRGIDAVMNVVGPALREAGGFILPVGSEAEYATAQTAKGGTVNIARLQVSYAFYGETGMPIVGTACAEAFDSGDKATAKAMSVAYRTFLLQLLCLPTDDPDPDTFSYEIADKEDKWATAIVDLQNKEQARELWESARRLKAPAAILEQIEAKAQTLKPKDA